MDGILIVYMGMDYIKGILLDDAGVERRTVQRQLNLFVSEGYVEQNPEEWLAAIIEIINDVQNSEEGDLLKSIAVTYQPGTFVCIDRSGKALMNAILPCDSRARYQVHICEKNFKKHGSDFNICWNYMILPKLLWIKYNKPDIYKRIFNVLTPDGYIAYRLSGETAIDNYSAVFLGYNIHALGYDKKLLKDLGLDSKMFPEVKRIGDCIGLVAGDVGEDIKLKNEMKFITFTNSLMPLLYRASCCAGSALYDAESSHICFAVDSIRTEHERALVRLPVKGMIACGIMGNYETRFLKLLDGIATHMENGKSNYTPGSNGVLVLPYIMGDNSFYSSDIRGSILGISDSCSRDIVTAVYEAIGYIIKGKLEYISYLNVPVQSLEILSDIQDGLFYRILSDITGKRVLIRNRSTELIRCIAGMLSGIDVEMQAPVGIINPDEENILKYRQLNSLYKGAYDSLNDVFKYQSRVIKSSTKNIL